MKYIYMNDLNYKEAQELPEPLFKTWLVHHSRTMRDCRDLNYGYCLVNDRIICSEGDTDITENINYYNIWELKHDYATPKLSVDYKTLAGYGNNRRSAIGTELEQDLKSEYPNAVKLRHVIMNVDNNTGLVSVVMPELNIIVDVTEDKVTVQKILNC